MAENLQQVLHRIHITYPVQPRSPFEAFIRGRYQLYLGALQFPRDPETFDAMFDPDFVRLTMEPLSGLSRRGGPDLPMGSGLEELRAAQQAEVSGHRLDYALVMARQTGDVISASSIHSYDEGELRVARLEMVTFSAGGLVLARAESQPQLLPSLPPLGGPTPGP